MDFRISSPEGRRILVLANCQTGGLTACLDLLLPKDIISGQSWSVTEKGRADAVAAAAEADVVVTSAPTELRARMAEEHGFDESKCLVVPSIHFSGFHPDLTVAYSDGKPIDGVGGTPYQSAIGVWCWKRGMGPGEARRLFTPETMSAVGFDRYWTTSAAQTREFFKDTQISFTDFFLPLQASGRLFMHTFNHPHISVIAQLARGVARLLGADEADLRQAVEIMIPDALSYSTVWPVYPGVAESLALAPSFLWKFGNTFYDLDGYLDGQFRALDAVAAPVACHPTDDPNFDAAMRMMAAR